VTNVLFVCIGNSCRSQMAEGFATKYGVDVLRAWSAGLAPAPIIQPQTVDVMGLRNIDIQEQFPKSIHELELNAFDLIVNMSGQPLPTGVRGEVREWDVADPMLHTEEVYIGVRDKIEGLVMQLILDLRRKGRMVSMPPSASVRNLPMAGSTAKPQNAGDSSQRFGFGRIRRARD
jgi:arsenate reductase